MKDKVFQFLKQYSTSTIEIDRLIISAFLQINNLRFANNIFLREYAIMENDEDNPALNTFIEIINSDGSDFSFEELISLFEFVISPSDREITGAVYTPSNIREYIVDNAIERCQTDLAQVRLADIACGCGGFLITSAIKIHQLTGYTYQNIFENSIFGMDIQEYSITRTKLLLTVLALSEGEDFESANFNLHQGDSLIFNWREVIPEFDGFNIIVGNPPYVRLKKLPESTKNLLQYWEVSESGLTDLYIVFFQIGFEALAANGILGYITMNSFFKSLNARKLRAYFQRNSPILEIIDFGSKQVFKSRNTYTCICMIENRASDIVSYCDAENSDLASLPESAVIPYANLDPHKGWNLKDHEQIEAIEAIGVPFGNLYKTRHGIATLKNDVFIFTPIREDRRFYYLKKHGETYPIERAICKDILNSNRLSRDYTIDEIKEVVIFPYIGDVQTKLISEDVLRRDYPRAFEYLLSNRTVLEKRDKGKGKYVWYAFGRTQSLSAIANKLFFPKYSDKNPNCIINNDRNLLFYNGMAIIGSNEDEMIIAKKLLESDIFWYYIKTTSKPYSSNYYSLNNNYINNFGVYNFSTEEKEYIINETNKVALNTFLFERYNVEL